MLIETRFGIFEPRNALHLDLNPKNPFIFLGRFSICCRHNYYYIFSQISVQDDVATIIYKLMSLCINATYNIIMQLMSLFYSLAYDLKAVYLN